MKITHRKKNQAFSCSTRVYLYNIESFSEAPIEIFSFFLLFLCFFKIFKTKVCILVIALFFLGCWSFKEFFDLFNWFQHWNSGQCPFMFFLDFFLLSAFIPSHRYCSMVRVTHIRLSVWTSCLVVEISCITSASWQDNILDCDDPGCCCMIRSP